MENSVCLRQVFIRLNIFDEKENDEIRKYSIQENHTQIYRDWVNQWASCQQNIDTNEEWIGDAKNSVGSIQISRQFTL